MMRNADTEYEFRQNSDFLYLTGFPEPEAVAVLRGGAQPCFTLFVRPRNRSAETWTGRRYGIEGARSEFGADRAFPIAELENRLPELLENTETLAYDFGNDESRDRLVHAAIKTVRERTRRGGRSPEQFISPGKLLHEHRLRKSAAEIQTLREAARITAAGFAAGMRATRPDLPEYALEAIIEAEYFRLGAQSVAYPSIVAGGVNAVILHYNTNRDSLRDGSLVLVDSGCELDSYASDVTRTWPVGGRFSSEQRAVYEIVLRAQEAAMLECVAGRPFDAYHHAATAVIIDGLKELGILSGSRDEILEKKSYLDYYMHRTGHWLGLDVHDAGRYTDGAVYRPLEPEMVLTVEPGIYIAEDAAVDERFRGIGVRIEDDVRITGGPPENLTAAIPKAVAELEAIVGQTQN